MSSMEEWLEVKIPALVQVLPDRTCAPGVPSVDPVLEFKLPPGELDRMLEQAKHKTISIASDPLSVQDSINRVFTALSSQPMTVDGRTSGSIQAVVPTLDSTGVSRHIQNILDKRNAQWEADQRVRKLLVAEREREHARRQKARQLDAQGLQDAVFELLPSGEMGRRLRLMLAEHRPMVGYYNDELPLPIYCAVCHPDESDERTSWPCPEVAAATLTEAQWSVYDQLVRDESGYYISYTSARGLED